MQKLYIVMQQGGSSTEWYCHAHPNKREAEADMKECGGNGGYKTVGPFEVDQALVKVLLKDKDAEGDFYNVIEEIVRGCSRI